MSEAKVIEFPMQPAIKNSLVEELLQVEFDIKLSIERANDIRARLGMKAMELLNEESYS